jgi:subtilisin family serine protease
VTIVASARAVARYSASMSVADVPAQQSTGVGLVRLDALMGRTRGHPDVRVALLDGPVATDHPELADVAMEAIGAGPDGASAHGTFIAGILSGRRGGAAPALAPDCTLLLRPIFDAEPGAGASAAPDEVAAALEEAVAAGARVVNLSAAPTLPSMRAERRLTAALDLAAMRGTLVVAAAGNAPAMGGTALTRHPQVLPVVGCDAAGRLLEGSTLGPSVGRRGLAAPGEGIVSLAPGGGRASSGGSSAAAAFVTGTVALLCSAFPTVPTSAIRRALTAGRRRSVSPPLLDAERALQALERGDGGWIDG